MIRLEENFGGESEPQPKLVSEQINEVNTAIVEAYKKILNLLHSDIGSFVIPEIKKEINSLVEILKRRNKLIRKYGFSTFFEIAARDERKVLILEGIQNDLDDAQPLDSEMINRIEKALYN